MSISIDVPTVHQDDSADLHYVLNGASDTRNKKKVLAVVLVDPATGNPSLPGGVQAGGNLTIADGADVTQGNKADNAGDPTVIGQLKTLASNTQTIADNTPRTATAANDVYTTTGTAGPSDVSLVPNSAFSLQVSGTGAAATAWTVVLEISLDDLIFTPILTHQTSSGNGTVVSVTGRPARFYRTRCTALTLGSATDIVAWGLAGS